MKIGAISFKRNIYNAIQPNAIVFAVSVFCQLLMTHGTYLV